MRHNARSARRRARRGNSRNRPTTNVTAANTHDIKAAISVLDKIVAKRPSSKINTKRQNLYLDKGYDFQEIETEVIKKGYLSHIRHRG
jgi:hypothetical protein